MIKTIFCIFSLSWAKILQLMPRLMVRIFEERMKNHQNQLLAKSAISLGWVRVIWVMAWREDWSWRKHEDPVYEVSMLHCITRSISWTTVSINKDVWRSEEFMKPQISLFPGSCVYIWVNHLASLPRQWDPLSPNKCFQCSNVNRKHWEKPPHK